MSRDPATGLLYCDRCKRVVGQVTVPNGSTPQVSRWLPFRVLSKDPFAADVRVQCEECRKA